MTDQSGVFHDRTGVSQDQPLDLWPSIVIAKEEIDAEIERLADLARPDNGRRESLIVHPRATKPGLGLAPGIRLTLSVLKPGEKTKAFRHNATEVNFCIHGSGHAMVGGRRFDFAQYDVWNTPSYTTYWHVNDSDALQVRLTYSNAALLEMMNIHLVDEDPSLVEEVKDRGEEAGRGDPRKKSPYGMFQLTDEGAWLMPYELLINPPTVESNPLHWPWEMVKEHVDKLEALGSEYIGRRLYTLYNPMTGRTNGITPSFFATNSASAHSSPWAIRSIAAEVEVAALMMDAAFIVSFGIM